MLNIDEHMPLPKPIATVNIEDDSPSDAPIKCFGTADAYVKPISADRMLVWIEENNLRFQNVSGKPILGGVAELSSSDSKGNQYHGWQSLGASKPGQTATLMGVKVPGSDHHIPWKHRSTYSLADYNLKPDVTPTATPHVIIVKFADGSRWEDKSRVGNVPKGALNYLDAK